MTETYDLIVIGAGSGGLTAAEFAIKLGASVALIEKERIGGDCTWTGCVPSKALLKAAKVAHQARVAGRYGIISDAPTVDMQQVRAYVRQAIDAVYQRETPEVLTGEGIDVVPGIARFVDAHTVQVGQRTLTGKKFIIATGAQPFIPPIPGLDQIQYLTYLQLFDLDHLPQRFLIIGAGPIGAEMAQAFQRLGSEVTLIDIGLLPREEPEVAEVMGRVFTREGIHFVPGLVSRAHQEGPEIVLTVDEHACRGDALLVAVGRTPHVNGLNLDKAGVSFSAKGIPVDPYLRTNVKHIYAAGDVVAGNHQFTHVAGWQAVQAARNALLPLNDQGFSPVVPWSTFTDPEVAHVGLSEAEAREKFGDGVLVTTTELGHVDRAVTEDDCEGFIKVVHRKNGKVLGATIVAARGGEIITEFALAIKHNLKLLDLANVIHAYPTYSIANQQLAGDAAIRAILDGPFGGLDSDRVEADPVIIEGQVNNLLQTIQTTEIGMSQNLMPIPLNTTKPDTKQDAGYVFYELIRSICPVCRTVIDAQILLRDNKVFMRKRCSEHGQFETLIYGDAEAYTNSTKFNKPGTIPATFSTEIVHGCPHDCGLCPDHQQHACVGIIEVNSACNMDCPLCFADAGHGFNLTLNEVENILDHFVRTEITPEVVQFSGGEPSIHPEIIPMMKAAMDRDIRHVMLNTNGKRIAHDDRFLAELGQIRPAIYFQFDGFDSETYRIIRNEPDILPEKLRALDRLAEIGCPVILIPAIERGVNEHEIGAIIKFAIDHPAVFGVNFQPAFHAGRYMEHDPLQRLTNPDLIKLVEAQTEGMFTQNDFIPVPCCFPTCNSVTYAYVDGETVVPLPRVLNVDDYLDYISNRVMMSIVEDIKQALEGLWSSSAIPGSQKAAYNFAMSCAACGLPEGTEDEDSILDHIFMIMFQDFLDPWTFNQKNLMKCCKEILLPDGKQIPFCAYNNVGYREQAREQLAAQEPARNQARRHGTKFEIQPLTFRFDRAYPHLPPVNGPNGTNGHK